MKEFKVISKPVLVGECALNYFTDFISSNFQSSKIFIITDSNCIQHCFPLFLKVLTSNTSLQVIEFPAGEQNKNLITAEYLLGELIKSNCSKNDIIINIGGGVVTDIGAFVASVYKRGLSFLNIPTSLMGMVDAAIGGKNGIDFLNYKNQIGTINFPELTLIDPVFLNTLSQRDFKNGLAEAFKHALVNDKELWVELISITDFNTAISDLLPSIVKVKCDIVNEDPHDKARRKVLNFGHTIGHAVESELLKSENPLLHGEAIVIGMIAELFLSVQFFGLENILSAEIQNKLLHTFNVNRNLQLNEDALLAWMSQDKKRNTNDFNFSLISDIGTSKHDFLIAEEQVKLAIRNTNKLLEQV
jgi:3-dehydroquinate synthase